ncbi:uncharacterized protein LOC131674325 [Phymastichus coffea]|uniref:uncharacterized protein LOC131674325 n=1 Tax=Phymastichus coffea TaxID=108790 RepID=UPI00273CD29C|nr:uncharacterized protein LOC131674325 [Phymastichus coffea]XP_058808911.1 uncharacterized protein LOC131674325 [Phymastichus coffea]XP_058808912.1 uncharacterized protein LOC131674325 [Phymastichus coffea]XP_058808913.1 uncharacterized protein LOC131674325 [Phymastichus coffea]XP_058808914.1 uncharacterized protein LOC131674325 [Phymastichus coffea]XP_058808915.1 uncharacterized protein LOC131674325 [Phymastichus coffea]XP_058808916.1 uncharacterized protein LOC131674325 [Phymastichus coffe
MATKKLSMIDYADEQTSSEEEDDMMVDPQAQEFIAQQHRMRPGRPRQSSFDKSNSSVDTNTAVSRAPVRRKGRGPSKRPCLNRNALMARENRQRKKEYIERIETKLQNYQAENQELTNTIQKQSVEIKRLGKEVTYLKGVLKNQTMITTLLKAMNNGLRRMHETGSQGAAQQLTPNTNSTVSGNNGINTASSDVLNWVISGQTNSSKKNNMPMPFSGTTVMRNNMEVCKDDSRRLSYAQQTTNNPVKIARKTMPFTTQNVIKTEDPPSVESLFEDEDHKNVQTFSPQSGSFCEYFKYGGSMGHNIQQPTTPISALSNSVDKAEVSLSNTDLSHLSPLSVDNLFDNIVDNVNPLQFEQGDLFSEETLFHSLDKEPSAPANNLINPLEINEMSKTINEKESSLFDSIDNAGVCLHINSTRVSLEYCSICHFNSLNSDIA